MGQIVFFFKIFLVTFLIGGIGFFVFSSDDLKDSFGVFFEDASNNVLGVQTKRMEKVNEQLSEDIGQHTETVKKDVLETSISDVIGTVMRLQKIPQDIEYGKTVLTDQFTNVLESIK